MQQTLYGDVLFIVNFTMDFLTLYITAMILRRKLRPRAFMVSASLGAAYGVASCFLPGATLLSLGIHFAVSFVMCYLAFGKRCLSCVALFYLVGCLLGGMMTAIYGYFGSISGTQTVYVDGSYRTVTGEIPLGWMAVVAALTGIAAIAGGRWLKKKQAAYDCRVGVLDEAGALIFTGLCDSGNCLSDPFSGRAVIVMSREAFLSVLPKALHEMALSEEPMCLEKIDAVYAKRIRLIPSQSVGGNALLFGYLPRVVTVNGIEKEAVLAMGKECFDGREALVPALLLEG